jgi:hypothetical protein
MTQTPKWLSRRSTGSQLSNSPLGDTPLSTALQRQTALIATRAFLQRLSDPKETRRVPLPIRREARSLLRHYPHEEDLRSLFQTGV